VTADITYENVFVQDDRYTLSGGQKKNVYSGALEPNQPQTEQFHFYRSPKSEIYVDFIGTLLKEADFINGRVVFDNGMNLKLVWVRGGNVTPEQQDMGPVSVVVAHVVNVVADNATGADNSPAGAVVPPTTVVAA
ncbi:unnamed protein product, partial [Symbiodinium pilosum]